MIRYLILALVLTNFVISGEGHSASRGVDVRSHILKLETDWETAMGRNDVARLNQVMAHDWRMISADGRVVTKAQAISALRSGVLRYDAVTFDGVEVRVYPKVAVVMGRSREQGKLRGNPFDERYIFTDVFVLRDGKWRSVLTHVTQVRP